MENYNICDDCEYNNVNSNEKPCYTCLNWNEGYLDSTNYKSEGLCNNE